MEPELILIPSGFYGAQSQWFILVYTGVSGCVCCFYGNAGRVSLVFVVGALVGPPGRQGALFPPATSESFHIRVFPAISGSFHIRCFPAISGSRHGGRGISGGPGGTGREMEGKGRGMRPRNRRRDTGKG